jgi:penicillin-binding protein 1C
MTGSAARIRAFLRGRAPLLLTLLALALLAVTDRSWPPPRMPAFSAQILDARGKLLSAYLTVDDKWRLRTTLDRVTPELVRAVIAKEDRYFLLHRGVNPAAVVRALFANLMQGRRVSGASTITMQLARLVEPAERSYISKLREALRALQLEARYSKRDILEFYLSLLPMGGNVEGVASAAYVYFDRPPDKLSPAQSIALALVANDPNRYRPDRGSDVLTLQKNRWVRRFSEQGVFAPDVIESARDEALGGRRYAMPADAPHLCQVLRRRGGADIVYSSIDGEIQDIAETMLRNHVRRVLPEGVSNGAVLIVRNDDLSVAAYCGSADFNDAGSQGQVDGVRALRSPGSTLKPFLYAMAFDEGSLTPLMQLADIPTDFGGYMPENFDLTYKGQITAREALLQSLNIPAVRLLAHHGVPGFLSYLSTLGFRSLDKQRDRLGLSMILGGCGVTLEELVRAGSTFARGGRIVPLRYVADSDHAAPQAVMSEAAAWLISDILSNAKRPDLPEELLAASRLPKIAWKTGTSYGKRDAWAIGWNARYTIGVWMGNFNGRGAPALSGAELAVPLLVDLFNAVDYDSGRPWLKKPDTVIPRDVCGKTGLLPSDRCGATVRDYAIKGVSTRERCSLMKEFVTDVAGNMHYCPQCDPQEETVRAWYPEYEPALALWFRENRVHVPVPPPHNPRCTASRQNEGPVILSPSADYEYLVEKGSGQQISLQAASPAGVRMLHWYVDGEILGKTAPGAKLFFSPTAATHRIVCLDDMGVRSTVTIRVKYY